MKVEVEIGNRRSVYKTNPFIIYSNGKSEQWMLGPMLLLLLIRVCKRLIEIYRHLSIQHITHVCCSIFSTFSLCCYLTQSIFSLSDARMMFVVDLLNRTLWCVCWSVSDCAHIFHLPLTIFFHFSRSPPPSHCVFNLFCLRYNMTGGIADFKRLNDFFSFCLFGLNRNVSREIE